jgi:hypothetical protein
VPGMSSLLPCVGVCVSLAVPCCFGCVTCWGVGVGGLPGVGGESAQGCLGPVCCGLACVPLPLVVWTGRGVGSYRRPGCFDRGRRSVGGGEACLARRACCWVIWLWCQAHRVLTSSTARRLPGVNCWISSASRLVVSGHRPPALSEAVHWCPSRSSICCRTVDGT